MQRKVMTYRHGKSTVYRCVLSAFALPTVMCFSPWTFPKLIDSSFISITCLQHVTYTVSVVRRHL
jgi:hypothetical protein